MEVMVCVWVADTLCLSVAALMQILNATELGAIANNRPSIQYPRSRLNITGRLTKRTFVRTTIYLANDVLVAEREDGLRLSHADAVQLADLLWENDVTSSEVFMIDWHEDAERAPLSGQKVVIYQRLRLHEQSLELRSTN